MFRGCRHYVSLVLCFVCILSMLSLDILRVDAAGVTSQLGMRGSLLTSGSNVDGDTVTFKIQPTYSNSSLTGLSLNGSITSSSNGDVDLDSNVDDVSNRSVVSGTGTTGSSSVSLQGYESSTGSINLTGRDSGSSTTITGSSSDDYSGNIDTTGSISFSENGSFSANISASENYSNGCFYEFRLPYKFDFPSDASIDPNAYYLLGLTGYPIESTGCTPYKFSIYDNQGNLISFNNTQYRYFMVKGSELLTATGPQNKRVLGYIDFYVNEVNIESVVNCSFKVRYNYNLYSMKDEYKYTAGSSSTSDVTTHQELSDLNTSTDNIEDSTTNPNGSGILGTIKSFFGSFFENIRNSLIAVFVPEDGYFSDWFDRLNTLLADKLGVLYYPFDLIISFLTDLQSESSQSGQIVFPEVSLPMNGENHVIIARTVLNLGDYDVCYSSSDNSSLVGTTGYTSIVSTIRTFSSFAICLALVFLFIKKLNHIINGEAS